VNFLVPYTVYPFDVMFSFGQSDKDVLAALKAHGVARRDKAYKLSPGDEAITVHYDTGFTLIRMGVVPKTPEAYGSLQHEIFHAVIYLMQYVGASLNEGSNENFAYIIGYLTRESYKKLLV
jgi:hypothetical protein